MLENNYYIEELEEAAIYNDFAKLLIEKQFDPALLSQGFRKASIPSWITESASPQIIRSYWIYRFFETGKTENLELWLAKGLMREDSSWFEDLWIKWQEKISSVFFLTGNINDYAFSCRRGFMPVTDFVTDEFINRPKGCRAIIRFSLSQSLELTMAEGINREESQADIIQKIETHNRDRQVSWDQLINDFKFIDDLLNNNEHLIIVIENADMIFATEGANIVQNLLADYLLRWAFSTAIAGNTNAVVLTAESSSGISRYVVSQSNKVEIIPIPRPKLEAERLRFLIFLQMMSTSNDTVNTRTKIRQLPDLNIIQNFSQQNRIARNLGSLAYHTSGLNYIGMEDLFLQINATKKSTVKVINDLKGNILQMESGGLLELVNSTKDLKKDICGYDEIKEQLMMISGIINDPNASKLRKRTVPMGILFVGPPGTGKTVVAEAFSNKCGMNFLKLGDFRSKWVGESERNLSRILELIKSYTPVIVFMDELDQTEGSRGTSGNADVDKRLFSKLLQFMSDTKNRGNVLWIAASNRPDIIDAALKRPGRFDLKLPFLPQGKQDRRATFDRYLLNEEYPELKSAITEEEWEVILTSTNQFTGAEIEEIVNSTIRKKIMDSPSLQGDIIIAGDDLLFTVQNFQPGISTKPFNDMIEASLADVTSKELIPVEWHNWKNPF